MSPLKQGGPIDLLDLYKHSSINSISKFSDASKQIDPNELVDAYFRVRDAAPKRHSRDKRYFVGHSGVTSSGNSSNRREEHLAVALWNATQDGHPFMLPNGSGLTLLDYQFPLKARQGDKGIGKVDLFGALNGGQSCVIELKIHSAANGYSDTPLRAFLEAFAYCAIVEANARDIAKEAHENFDLALEADRPALVIMAPEEYWSGYLNHKSTGEWWAAFNSLADRLAELLAMEFHFIALRNSGFSMGLNGQKAQLTEDCTLVRVADVAKITSPGIQASGL